MTDDFGLGVLVTVFGLIVVLIVGALVSDAIRWWKNREIRRWPDYGEWKALEDVVYRRNWDLTENERDRAKLAFRKLRFKHRKKTGYFP